MSIDGLEQVIVYGMTEESDIPAWQESITLSQDDLIVNLVTKLNSLPIITAEIAENDPEDAPEALEDSETTEEIDESEGNRQTKSFLQRDKM